MPSSRRPELTPLELVLFGLAALVLLGAVILMNIEVAGRSLFGTSTQIADEYAGYALAWMTMLCLVPALRRDRFLRLNLFLRLVPGPARAVLEGLGALIGAGVSAVLAWSSLQLAWTSWDYGSVSLQPSQTPLFIPQAVLPAGFALVGLVYLYHGWRSAQRHWHAPAKARP